MRSSDTQTSQSDNTSMHSGSMHQSMLARAIGFHCVQTHFGCIPNSARAVGHLLEVEDKCSHMFEFSIRVITVLYRTFFSLRQSVHRMGRWHWRRLATEVFEEEEDEEEMSCANHVHVHVAFASAGQRDEEKNQPG